MTESTTTAAPEASGRAFFRSMLPTLLWSVVLPLIVLNVAKAHGASDLTAYLLASIGPLVQTLGSALIRRRTDRLSLLVLLLTLVSAAVTFVGSTSSVVLLLKDSVATAVFGLYCLVTLVVGRRPLMFSFAQQFSGGADTPRGRVFDERWEVVPAFRRFFRILTAAWGVAFLLEAAVKVVVAETVSFRAAFNLNQVLPLVVTVAMMVWTVSWARRARRARADSGTGAHAAG